MKHLPDLLTLWHRHPLFHSSICPSVFPSVNSSVMWKFDIYVKASILINYKTKQPSNLAWNIPLTSWFCNKGICFSVPPSVCPSVNIYSNQLQFYNNHHTLYNTSPWPPDLSGTLTWWPWPIFHTPVTLTQFTLRFQIFLTIRPTTTKPCIVLLLDVLTRQVSWSNGLDLYFALQWLTHFASTFDISTTIRPTTVKPCKVFLLNVLTQQIPWPGDLDLYFGWSDFDIM